MNILTIGDGKNHNFGKLVDGILELAPAALIVSDMQYIGNNSARYKGAGYLPIVYAEKPEDTDTGHYEAVYTETDGTIVQSWEFVSDQFWTEEDVFNLTSNRTAITSFKLPQTTTKIPRYFFYEMSRVVFEEGLPETIEKIEDYAFYGSQVNLDKLPDNLKTIGNNVFRRTDLTITELPQFLETLGGNCFQNLVGIAIKEMPSSVISIGDRAFEGCTSITEMTFKGTPTTIGANTFSKCTNLTVINVPWSQTDAINANSPWGATNAEINYNYIETEE